VEKASYFDENYAHFFTINRNDNIKPVPVRGKWLENVRNYDFKDEVQNIKTPVLICVGKYDLQTPLIMSQELNNKIKGSKIKVFEKSGHSPFIEENKEFLDTINTFLAK
jgi:pimeloyl-ACP methyl ester carboxylesterase